MQSPVYPKPIGVSYLEYKNGGMGYHRLVIILVLTSVCIRGDRQTCDDGGLDLPTFISEHRSPRAAGGKGGKRRLVQAVFGNSGVDFLRTLEQVAHARPGLKGDVSRLQVEIASLTSRALRMAKLELRADRTSIAKAERALEQPATPDIVLTSASWGPRVCPLCRADVKWILQKLVCNNVLRIPKHFDISALFGTRPRGEHTMVVVYTLDVEAETLNGKVFRSILAPEFILQADLVISNAQP